MALNPLQKGTFKVSAEQPGTVVVEGSWETNGSSAISTTRNATDTSKLRGSPNWTVARTGVGTADVTFDMKYFRLDNFQCSIQRSALADSGVQAGPYTAPTQTAKGKIAINHLVLSTGLAAEWPAANADNRVHFRAVFKRTKNI